MHSKLSFPGFSVVDTLGHTKGVVVFGEKQGFWLVHSVPKYPPAPDGDSKGYSYPPTGQKNGQSFLCVSLETASAADHVGGQLAFNDPYWYEPALNV